MSTFHRRVDITSLQHQTAGTVRAALEDNFHHFRVWVRHYDRVLTAIGGEALRYPYSACPEATDQLQQLVGMPLDAIAHSVTRQVDAQHQCTHLLDLAGLAIANAARQTTRRRYDIQIPQRVDGHTSARLLRDGCELLTWELKDSVVQAPDPYCNINLRQGMARWALDTLPHEEAEAALLLRRCTLISLGLEKNLDAQVHASSTGLCYSQQPDRAAIAARIIGSTWNFSERQPTLCADDQLWLSQLTLSPAGSA
ncbi:hypothetical protein A8C75_19295 [Marinobacterium aestuarii]|uniref:DUF2889 domain-containing protein n=1 Tax=Marinobacterium aestuarii TaxID=1821621 RepID=A0A1A9F260_9GAMM|nr:DUF2889 domain-containing protein [Marinobacterium aestuarii]ANG64404.1 hypothetical protein A8C75_19295 [Marinobacterium aestuarii]